MVVSGNQRGTTCGPRSLAGNERKRVGYSTRVSTLYDGAASFLRLARRRRLGTDPIANR
jgi:hypothetical protein